MNLRISWGIRQWILLVVVAVLIGFGVKQYFRTPRLYDNQPQSHTFQGQLLQVLNDGSLVLKGTRMNDADPDKSDFRNPETVTVKVTSDTEWVKTLLYLPTAEETNKTGGMFYPKDLKKEEVKGSLEDIKDHTGLGLTIKTKNSTQVGEKTMTAQEIDYIEPVYPK
jgi:hypothetical protein